LREAVGGIVAEAERVGGGEDRFWQLYDEGLPHVYGYLLRRSDRATAEDLTQEVFVGLARRVRAGTVGESLTVGWLLTVARSRLLDHMRALQRSERKLQLAWSAAEPEARAGMVDVDPSAEDLAPTTERALEALPPVQRYVLVLHHLDGYPVADVADAIGRSVRATESLLARARRTFRAEFEGAGDD
jgi:RNA polymerase sigma-70 factor (ECF subfamily)